MFPRCSLICFEDRVYVFTAARIEGLSAHVEGKLVAPPCRSAEIEEIGRRIVDALGQYGAEISAAEAGSGKGPLDEIEGFSTSTRARRKLGQVAISSVDDRYKFLPIRVRGKTGSAIDQESVQCPADASEIQVGQLAVNAAMISLRHNA